MTAQAWLVVAVCVGYPLLAAAVTYALVGWAWRATGTITVASAHGFARGDRVVSAGNWFRVVRVLDETHLRVRLCRPNRRQ